MFHRTGCWLLLTLPLMGGCGHVDGPPDPPLVEIDIVRPQVGNPLWINVRFSGFPPSSTVQSSMPPGQETPTQSMLRHRVNSVQWNERQLTPEELQRLNVAIRSNQATYLEPRFVGSFIQFDAHLKVVVRMGTAGCEVFEARDTLGSGVRQRRPR